MIRASIIPDGHVVHVLPPVAQLQVVVLADELHEPLQEVLRLGLVEAVDHLHVVADGVHALPARHRVRADDGVHGLEHLADVLGRAPRAFVHSVSALLSWFGERGTRAVGR